MSKGKLLMRVDIIEEADHLAVKLISASGHHVESCANCLAMFALRISHAIAERVRDLEHGEHGEDDDDAAQHPLH